MWMLPTFCPLALTIGNEIVEVVLERIRKLADIGSGLSGFWPSVLQDFRTSGLKFGKLSKLCFAVRPHSQVTIMITLELCMSFAAGVLTVIGSMTLVLCFRTSGLWAAGLCNYSKFSFAVWPFHVRPQPLCLTFRVCVLSLLEHTDATILFG